jgi:hypothetical protein
MPMKTLAVALMPSVGSRRGGKPVSSSLVKLTKADNTGVEWWN